MVKSIVANNQVSMGPGFDSRPTQYFFFGFFFAQSYYIYLLDLGTSLNLLKSVEMQLVEFCQPRVSTNDPIGTDTIGCVRM